MSRATLVILLSILVPSSALAQDGREESARLKNAILAKVKARLEQEHRRILERVSRIIDEELSGQGPPAASPDGEQERKIAELEAKLDELEKQKQRLRSEIDRLRRQAVGKDDEEQVKADAKAKGPQTMEEAQELFQEAFQDHEDKDYESAIRKNKYVYYQFPDSPLGNTAAYNIACAYSLRGEKAKACEWLEISFKHGFSKFDHVRQDPDLDNIREEKRYLELMADR